MKSTGRRKVISTQTYVFTLGAVRVFDLPYSN